MEQYLKNKINPQSLVTLFSQAPVALAMLRGKEMIVEAANQNILDLWGKTEAIISLRLLDGLPELKGQEFPKLLQQVFDTGVSYKGHSSPAKILRNGILETSYFDFIYSPILEDSKVVGVSVIGSDVTDKVLSEKKLGESEYKFTDIILNSDYSSAVYTGPNFIVELANEKMLKTWGKSSEVIGLKLIEAVPELESQHFLQTLSEVYESGVAFQAKEDRVEIIIDGKMEVSYYNYNYQPLRNSEGKVYAIFNTAVEVTDMVLAKKSAVDNFNKLQDFIENVPMAIAVYTGPDLNLEMCNQDANKFWGELTTYYGTPFKDIFPEFGNAGLLENFIKVYKSGEQLELKEVNLRREGLTEDRYFNFILHPTKDDNGTTSSVIAIGYDITQELVMRSDLSNSEKKYKNLAEAIPQIIWTSDVDGIITYCNERLQFYLGTENSNPVGNSFFYLSHPEDLPQIQTIWKNAVSSKVSFEVEHRVFNISAQKYFWFLTRGIPSFDETGNILQWIGTSTDINEFKLLESQKDTFLGIASHELKTPLTSLKIYAQVLERVLKKAGDEKNAEFARKMDVQVSKLNSLIGDLLDVTKISAGKIQFVETDFNIEDLGKEMVQELQLNSKHRITFEEISGGMVFADKNRISQVMSNLISNAIKYSPNAEEIIVSTTKYENEIRFSVQDFGIGIPEDKKDKVFEQYYRVSGDEQYTFPGLGLGLYISADIIERSKGKIWVNSVMGKGSTFCFSLPLKEKL